MRPSYDRDLVDEERQRLGARALLAVLLDDAVGDLDDRLDRQRRGQQGLGVADAAALAQVVERVEGAEHPGAGDELAGVALDGVEVVAGGRPLGAGEGDRAEAERDACGCRRCARRGRRRRPSRAASSALCIVADSAPDSVTTTMPVGAALGEAAVRLLEAARRGCRRRRQLRRRRAAGPELGRRQLLAVDELLVAEADAQRHDLDAPLR